MKFLAELFWLENSLRSTPLSMVTFKFIVYIVDQCVNTWLASYTFKILIINAISVFNEQYTSRYVAVMAYSKST